MGENSHLSDPPLTHNQDNAISDDPKDGRRLTDEPGAASSAPVGSKKPQQSEQDEATVEDFAREGMGVAAKE